MICVITANYITSASIDIDVEINVLNMLTQIKNNNYDTHVNDKYWFWSSIFWGPYKKRYSIWFQNMMATRTCYVIHRYTSSEVHRLWMSNKTVCLFKEKIGNCGGNYRHKTTSSFHLFEFEQDCDFAVGNWFLFCDKLTICNYESWTSAYENTSNTNLAGLRKWIWEIGSVVVNTWNEERKKKKWHGKNSV